MKKRNISIVLVVTAFITFSFFIIIIFSKSVYKLKGTLVFSSNGGDLSLLKLNNLISKQSWIDTKPLFTVSHPNFGHDLEKIVFSKYVVNKSDNTYLRTYTIAIFDLSTKKIENEFGVPFMECDYPAWSPDGKRIAFLAGDNLVNGSEVIAKDGFSDPPLGNVYLYDIDKKSVRKISDTQTFRSSPSWLNNTELIFASPNQDILKVNLDTQVEEKLKIIYGYAPAYCSINKKIAIRAKENIYISNLDGTELKYLVTSYNRHIESLPSGYPTELTWSPDGKFLIYTREGKCFDKTAVVSDMIVVDVNNPKVKRKLYTGGGNFWGVSWSK